MPPTTDERAWFDKFASFVSDQAVSKAWFFLLCVLMVVLWAPTLFLMDLNTSQLIINTLTTIITFLLVALLQNTQSRADKALQTKLDVIARAVADLMDAHERDDDTMRADARRLREAIGMERRQGS